MGGVKANEEREMERKKKGKVGVSQKNIHRTGDEAKVYDDTYDELPRKLSSFGNDYPIICYFLFSHFSNPFSFNSITFLF